MGLSEKIKEIFPEFSILHSKAMKDLFEGRSDLPAFIRSFLIKKFTDSNTGVIDNEKLQDFLSNEMTTDGNAVKLDLHSGKIVTMICRFNVKIDMKLGKVSFSIPDFNLDLAYIVPSVVEKYRDYLCEGKDIWGKIKMEYIQPEGKRWGYTNMIEFKPFLPYAVANLDYYIKGMSKLTLDERIDLIISSIGYNPLAFSGKTEEETFIKKHEFCSRYMIAVEPYLNVIELGPKGTGKSYLTNNTSKRFGCSANGTATRADWFYNKRTGMPGPIKTCDVFFIDEISSFDVNTEFLSTLKCYLESGTLPMGRDKFTPSYGCGIGLLGNRPFSNEMTPLDNEHYKFLPRKFRDSALLDRFHAYIEGEKIPRLSMDCLYEGWALNLEFFSEILHTLRMRPEYGQIFDAVVSYEPSADIRDVKAVQKVATAYAKLFFPHVTDLSKMSPEELAEFRSQYEKYCLIPAIQKRGIIRQQCHLIDKEFKEAMPDFYMMEDAVESEAETIEPMPKVDDEEKDSGDSAEEKIYIHSLFLSEGEFKEGEKEDRMRLIEDAEHWIEEQASQYGKKITFVNGVTGLEEGMTVHAPTPKDLSRPECHGGDTNYYLGLANKSFNVEEILYTSRQRGCSRAALLVVVDASGRSFAGWQARGEEHMGCAVLYGDDNLRLHSGDAAHELLHLMGAVDLYADYQPAENVAFMEENYPNEVMFEKDHMPAKTLEISPYTAWRIGWTDEKEDWFDKIVSQTER